MIRKAWIVIAKEAKRLLSKKDCKTRKGTEGRPAMNAALVKADKLINEADKCCQRVWERLIAGWAAEYNRAIAGGDKELADDASRHIQFCREKLAMYREALR